MNKVYKAIFPSVGFFFELSKSEMNLKFRMFVDGI